jgi:hypothetical protein
MKATFEFCVEIPLDQNTEWPVVVPPVTATRLVEGRYGWAWVPIDRQPICDHCGKLVYPSLLTEQLGIRWRHCPVEGALGFGKGYWSCFISRSNGTLYQAEVNGSDKPPQS